MGKTTLAMAFSKALGLQNKRIQFTPDTLPSDITGFTMYNRESNRFEYRDGAANCQLLLADEINRTSPKTQSALLEVMEEHTITVDGKTIGIIGFGRIGQTCRPRFCASPPRTPWVRPVPSPCRNPSWTGLWSASPSATRRWRTR